MTLGIRRTAVLVIVAFVVSLTQPTSNAATPLTVAQAITTQNGTSQTVRGYVVGQPTATNTVVTSNYPNDYALAIADGAAETSTSKMLFVQIPSAFRAQWGLRTNPSLKGKQIDVTGTLAAYFSHPGMTGTTAFSFSGGGRPPPPGGSSPYDATYYSPAIGKTGTGLRAELHAIIKVHDKLTYDQVWNALKDTDQDPNNAANLIELYSGRTISKSTNGGDPDDWNREHVWAQSHGNFGTATGPGTDLHHPRPEDVTVNSTRGNKDRPRRYGGQPVQRLLDRQRLVRAGGRGQGRRCPDALLHGDPVRGRGPGECVRDAPQRRHLEHLPAQPEPVHRPPGVGRGGVLRLRGLGGCLN